MQRLHIYDEEKDTDLNQFMKDMNLPQDTVIAPAQTALKRN